MLLDVLKQSTRDDHRTLEAALDLGAAEQEPSQYVAVLKMFYGFLQPWEPLVAGKLSGPLRSMFDERRKLPWLERDLAALRIGDPASLPTCTELPEVANEAAAVGSWYVLEGSTLGGQVITRLINGRWGLLPNHGLAYFSAYGDATRERWREFRQTAEQAVPESRQDEAALAARATFQVLHRWATRCGAAKTNVRSSST